MKRNLIILILMFMIQAAFADIFPHYINSIKHYGIGFTSVKSPLVVKKEPDANAQTIETISFDYKNNINCLNYKNCEAEKIFSVYSTEKKIALMTTLDETQGYNFVCSNEANPLCGWVENKNNVFYNWNMFFNILGKKYGLYAFKDITKNDKIIYASPDKNSNSTGALEMPKYISPWLVQGNWVLVKVNDFNSKQKTGWINFRGEDGKLKFFVNFK